MYLGKFLKAAGESPEVHPVLLLSACREIALSMLRNVSLELAIGIYKSLIRPLWHDAGQFIPFSGFVRREVEAIPEKLKEGDGR